MTRCKNIYKRRWARKRRGFLLFLFESLRWAPRIILYGMLYHQDNWGRERGERGERGPFYSERYQRPLFFWYVHVQGERGRKILFPLIGQNYRQVGAHQKRTFLPPFPRIISMQFLSRIRKFMFLHKLEIRNKKQRDSGKSQGQT